MKNEEWEMKPSEQQQPSTNEGQVTPAAVGAHSSFFISHFSFISVNICRLILAGVLIFSGFVKAVDPLGTQYKIHDYLTALSLERLLPDWVTLTLSVGLSALEFTLGICLLFVIQRRLVTRLTVVLMIIMTFLTLWLAVANPISDCGCFGDAVHLTNWQTFWKNILLLSCAVVAALWPLRMMRLISETNQWIVVHYTILFIVFVSLYCLYTLPLFDFRPYHVGTDIAEAMAIPDDAEQPEFETTFIMEKDGQRKEFTLDDYPDSTWTFVDARTVQTRQGFVPPIHDLMMEDAEGNDLTEDIISRRGYTFLLVAPHLEAASDRHFGDIEQLYEYAQEHRYPFYCLTASGNAARMEWQDRTGAEYPFLTTDEVTLKTIVRSNPGLLLLKDGVIQQKWSHNALPVIEQGQTSYPLEQQPFGQLATTSVTRKVVSLFLWFVLPLFLLTLADRTWAWTHWVRRKTMKSEARKTASEQS